MSTKTTQLPNAAELLEAVSGFMEKKLLPAINDGDAANQKFNTRVAINVLGIVQRELQQSPDTVLINKLADLLGETADNMEHLLIQLAERIRNGDFGEDNPALLSILRQQTLNRLAVDNPKYSGYLAATTEN